MKTTRSIAKNLAHRWKRATFRSSCRTINVAGVELKVSIDDLFGRQVYHNERYWPELQWVSEHVQDGPELIIDVGANQGVTTTFYAKSFPSAVVIAVEPHPFNATQILKNARLNVIGNIVLAHCAASDRTGDVHISNHSNAAIVEGGTICVPMCKLDDICFGPAKFVKVDVEGFEMSVLRGAKTLIATYKPSMDIEVHLFLHEDRYSFLRGVVDWLTPFGYKFDVVAGYQGSLVREPSKADLDKLSNEHVVNLLCRPQ